MDYFDRLKEKYNYSDEFIDLLKVIVFNVIDYYGEEYKARILDKFMETPILLLDKDSTKEDILKFENSIGSKKHNVNCINFPGFEEGFQLDENGNIERIPYIIIPNVDLLDKASMFSLIHEIGHMIMLNNIEINDNCVSYTIGVLKVTLKKENGRLVETDKYLYMEEGFNQLDALSITNNIISNYNPERIGYAFYYGMWNYLLRDEKLKKRAIDSRLNGNNECLKIFEDILGSELATLCIDAFEKDDPGMYDELANQIMNKADEYYDRKNNFAK